MRRLTVTLVIAVVLSLACARNPFPVPAEPTPTPGQCDQSPMISADLPAQEVFTVENLRERDVCVAGFDPGESPRLTIVDPTGAEWHYDDQVAAAGDGTHLWRVWPGLGDSYGGRGRYSYEIEGSTAIASGYFEVVAATSPVVLTVSDESCCVTLAFAGFAPGEQVEVTVHGPDGMILPAPPVTIDADGEQHYTWRIPDSLGDGAYELRLNPTGDGCLDGCGQFYVSP